MDSNYATFVSTLLLWHYYIDFLLLKSLVVASILFIKKILIVIAFVQNPLLSKFNLYIFPEVIDNLGFVIRYQFRFIVIVFLEISFVTRESKITKFKPVFNKFNRILLMVWGLS